MLAISDGGLSDSISGVNLPGVVLLAVSGVGAMFFIVRWMVRFQREFTDVYVTENRALRDRIDTLTADVTAKDISAAKAERALLKYEGDSERRIRDLELTILRHERTISEHETTIAQLLRSNSHKGDTP